MQVPKNKISLLSLILHNQTGTLVIWVACDRILIRKTYQKLHAFSALIGRFVTYSQLDKEKRSHTITKMYSTQLYSITRLMVQLHIEF